MSRNDMSQRLATSIVIDAPLALEGTRARYLSPGDFSDGLSWLQPPHSCAMNMNHSTSMDSPPSFPPGYPPCALYGNGTTRYGHYKPTSAESAYCQSANEPWGASVTLRCGVFVNSLKQPPM
jgi:hypothetical protein